MIIGGRSSLSSHHLGEWSSWHLSRKGLGAIAYLVVFARSRLQRLAYALRTPATGRRHVRVREPRHCRAPRVAALNEPITVRTLSRCPSFWSRCLDPALAQVKLPDGAPHTSEAHDPHRQSSAASGMNARPRPRATLTKVS